ncbi:MAG: formyltransferase [Rhodocyclaceae bacterium]|nr:formyltransferase [Rhodocyclaceae bacterium]
MRAVVFAYHEVGARCLQALLDGGVDVALVITHTDDPNERIWFTSVAEVATQAGIPVITPASASEPDVQARIAAIAPDYIFSFYYRQMIPMSVLNLAKIAPLNMHGSLLPKYRGRVPINWAVLHGETETGATLHVMAEKPDAGDIVAQQAVPIEPDETAGEVFAKVTTAAAETLKGVLPQLLKGEVPRRPNQLSEGSYFGGRKPEDGRINWQQTAAQVYNLIRAVAPPYPGAFTDLATAQGNRRITVNAARRLDAPFKLPPGLYRVGAKAIGVCGDKMAVQITDFLVDGMPGTPDALPEAVVTH